MREKQQNKGTIEISDSVLDIAHEVVEKCHVKHFYRRDGKVDELMNKADTTFVWAKKTNYVANQLTINWKFILCPQIGAGINKNTLYIYSSWSDFWEIFLDFDAEVIYK